MSVVVRPKNLALIRVVDFVAPRHLKAIKDTGNTLIVALDPHDSVGTPDNYFPAAHFFTSYERFEHHLEKLHYQDGEQRAEYISICSPNYFRDTHIRLALHVDLLIWLFGAVESFELHLANDDKMAGFVELERARVSWYLSVDSDDVPHTAKSYAFRSITIDGQEIEFSGGFTDLHAGAYEEILAGRGFGLDNARPSLELVYGIRHSEPVFKPTVLHPALRR